MPAASGLLPPAGFAQTLLASSSAILPLRLGKTPCNAPTRMKAVYHCFATGSPCPTDAPRSLETQTRHSPTVLRYATDCRTTAVRSAPTESYRLSWCIHRSQSVQIPLPVRSRCCYRLFKDDGLFLSTTTSLLRHHSEPSAPNCFAHRVPALLPGLRSCCQ